MAMDYGRIEQDGKRYVLTEQAYAENYRDTVRYYAHAVDREENIYLVTWDLQEGFDGTDEADACNWSNPISIEEVIR